MSENNYGLPDTITAQSLFDKSARHLLGMTEACSLQGNAEFGLMCNYRDDRGNACAIGCLISDDDYDTRIETKQVSALLEGIDRSRTHSDVLPFVFPKVMAEHVMLLSALQCVHDSPRNRFPDSKRFIPGAVRQHLLHVAKDTGLKTDVLMETTDEQQ